MQQQTIVSKLMSGQDKRHGTKFNELVRQGAYLHQNMGSGVNLREIGGQIPLDPMQLMEQNENIRLLLQNIRSQRSLISNPSIIISNPEQPSMGTEIQHATNMNIQKMLELETRIRNQQVAIQEYQRGFMELEANIQSLRVLDSDIYKRLTERDTTQFENRIIEVKKALKTNAPYEILLAMLNDIKI